MGVSKGHVKVDDLKKKTEAVVAALNLPIQVTVSCLSTNSALIHLVELAMLHRH